MKRGHGGTNRSGIARDEAGSSVSCSFREVTQMGISKDTIKENFNRFVSRRFNPFATWRAVRVPGWLIYLALMFLASKAYFQFESGGNFSEVLRRT
jgi:hypothetical protein